MTEQVTYAYAVLRPVGGIGEVLARVEGVAGTRVRLVPGGHGDVPAAAVSSVPAQDFLEAPLHHHLEDLDWLERVARAHHTVIEALVARTTVLPLRLATVYLDDDRVVEMLKGETDAFAHALERLAGHLEWGVKIYVEPQPDAPPTSPSGTAGGLSPGRAYLRARRTERHSRDESYGIAQRAAERIEAIGGAMAAAHARHRVQQGELAVGVGENVVNDAYLLTHDAAAEFRTEVLDAVQDLPGVRIDITGPWAPYSFADLPGTQPRTSDPAP
ncbi:GvpL/GvpF family gas vesicle protein [Streptomyces sp. NPDC004528]|uniref:GvpL/GvpF family gas vesicle protein n=1 Tax=Streptomyces sp. NPDC004528 TaxID=3154550 RepID=UPI0033AA6FE6